MNFKVETGFVCQPQYFFENISDIFNEERIDERVYYFSMFVSRMFIQNDVILNKEMRNIVV